MTLAVQTLLFRHFWDALAVSGALAEWVLGCWFLGAPPLVLHLLGPLALVIVNRLAAKSFEHEPPVGILGGAVGPVVFAVAFASLVSAGVLTVLASGWTVLWLLGTLTAQAGATVAVGSEPLFGPGFRALGSLAVLASTIAVADGYLRGHRRLRMTSLAAPVRALSAPLDGLRLVHISDFHLGPLADRDAVREAVDRVVALDADLVCVTGDIVDSPGTDLAAWMPELARLTARHGVYAILGNHDQYVGAERVAAAVARWTPWRVLRDDVATIDVRGARLHLVGLEHRASTQAAAALPALLARVP
ncbi:MAG TPA: metallophosphoesterase, partial [Candidatus Binatia bacterium]|nr:metallophosphoesterase [Candidatus Binatia bacterium]